ncbi:MAG: IS21 family transposase, partial [Acidobacteriota bacterium]|nr:IS21 family transposase [Acidobacteriota bacterium]
GRVERAIRFVRESFFAARPFTTLEDFNRQAWRWRDEIAHTRRWPGDGKRTVGELFEEERHVLLPLPKHAMETDQVKTVRSAKTIYIRFDLNDYSIPPTAVGRNLVLVASDRRIRLFDGEKQVAEHKRSYDRGRKIEDPAHQEALLKEKRKAYGATRQGRLVAAVPESEALLEAAFRRGEPSGAQAAQLLRLLDDYGAEEMRSAVCEALERGTPRASSVAYILGQRHRAKTRKRLLPVALQRRPDLENLCVQPHDPETYDELTHHDPDA